MKLLFNVVVLVICLQFSEVISQELHFIEKKEELKIEESSGEPKIIKSHSILGSDGKEYEIKTNHTEMIDLIVEFKEIPLLVQKKIGLQKVNSTSFYLDRFNQFNDDINLNHKKLSKKNNDIGEKTILTDKFYKVFFGASVKASRGMMSNISELAYVKRVHISKTVKATIVEGDSMIKADKVREQYKTDGNKIKVAVLDTGIDYMHPFLGGGFGEGFKVTGGYDFVDDDTDPMDMHMHGTHVAGIIAGKNDKVTGVAPGVSLYAVRVLDADGKGDEINIIKAIEYCVDPNEDGNIDDKMDIVNMSLGGSGGSPFDAMCIAVDNASSLGVTFCIAAGNEGGGVFGEAKRFFTVGTPGTAKSAITVGAIDKQNNIANFSSRGPIFGSYTIKPDVVAPGVDISSSVLNGKFEEASGTSMATPFVAGVCALIKSVNSEWTPKKIKSALMTSAIDLDEDVMEQGNGKVDALEAIKREVFTYPQNLGFGVDSIVNKNWEENLDLTFYNDSKVGKNYEISFDGIISGVNLTSNVSSISINPEDSAKISFNINVDNNLVDYLPSGSSMTYEGDVIFASQSDTIKVPWAFVKLFHVTLKFNSAFPFFDLLSEKNQMGFEQAYWKDDYTAVLALNYGQYDFICHGSTGDGYNYTIVEPINITQEKRQFNIDLNKAQNKIMVSGLDNRKDFLAKHDLYNRRVKVSLDSTVFVKSISNTISYIDWFKITGELPDEVVQLYQDLSSDCEIMVTEWTADFNNSKEIYLNNYPIKKGLTEDYKFQSGIENYHSRQINYEFPHDADMNAFLFGVYDYNKKDGKEYYLRNGFTISYLSEIKNKWEGTIYANKNVDPSHIILPILQTYDNGLLSIPCGSVQLGYDYYNEIAPIWISSEGDINTYWHGDSTTILPEEFYGNGILIGSSPMHIYSDWITNEQSNVVEADFHFRGQFNENRVKQQDLAILSVYNASGDLVSTEKLIESKAKRLQDAKYTFEIISEDYWVDKIKGKAILKSSFDLSSSDAKPPTLTSLRFVDEKGAAIKAIKKDKKAFMEFSVADFNAYRNQYLGKYDTLLVGKYQNYKSIIDDSTKVFFKLINEKEWSEFPKDRIIKFSENESQGILYKCDLESYTKLDSNALSIKIYFCDEAGNKTEWLLDPGFRIGELPDITNIDGEEDSESQLPKVFSLDQNYPNPFNPSTTIKFSLTENSKTTLKIYNVIGEEVMELINAEMNAGNHKIVFDASKLTSGIYFYQLKSGRNTEVKKMVLLK